MMDMKVELQVGVELEIGLTVFRCFGIEANKTHPTTVHSVAF